MQKIYKYLIAPICCFITVAITLFLRTIPRGEMETLELIKGLTFIGTLVGWPIGIIGLKENKPLAILNIVVGCYPIFLIAVAIIAGVVLILTLSGWLPTVLQEL